MESAQFKEKSFDRTNEAIMLYFIFLFLFGLLLLKALMALHNNFLFQNYGYLVMYCPGFAGLIASRVDQVPSSHLGFKKCPAKYLMIGIAIPIITWSLSYSIYGAFMPGVKISSFHFTKMLILNVPINLFFALGEEIGWRGFLTPVMTAKFGFIKASLLIGLIWGLWHGPRFLDGYYYNGATIPFVLSTVALSIIMSYLRLKTQSIWPAVMLHGSVNYIEDILDSLIYDGPQRVRLIGACGIITVGLTVLTAVAVLWIQKKHLVGVASEPLDTVGENF